MNRWLGVGADYLERYSKRTDNVVFLHIKRTKKQVEEKQEAPAEKVSLKLCYNSRLPGLPPHFGNAIFSVTERCHDWQSTWRGGSRLTRKLSMMRRLPLFCFRPCRKLRYKLFNPILPPPHACFTGYISRTANGRLSSSCRHQDCSLGYQTVSNQCRCEISKKGGETFKFEKRNAMGFS